MCNYMKILSETCQCCNSYVNLLSEQLNNICKKPDYKVVKLLRLMTSEHSEVRYISLAKSRF